MTALTRRRGFWIAYGVLAALALVLAAVLFPHAIPIVNLDVTAGRAEVLARARQVAAQRSLGPAHAHSAVRFDHDGKTQNYVELEGGGKAAFAALTRGKLYAPYWWEVRLFVPGMIEETRIRLDPDGVISGFVRRVAETYVRDPATRALAPAAARTLAEAHARADWGVDLTPYTLIEQSQETRISGRVDHALVYERPEPLGEARVRLRLAVAGDELVGIVPFVHVPQHFERRFAQLRSTNNLIAGLASIAALLVYGVGGIVLGSLWLARRRWLLWRPAVVAGACVSGLLALASLAAAPAGWFAADTTETAFLFWSKQVGLSLAIFVFGALAYGAVFMAAESLARRAFAHQPQLWRVWDRDAGASRQVLGRTLGGYLFVPIELALIAVFYYATNRWLGWWQPSEMLTDPNILGAAVPALAPIATSLQAGFWEECAFRAIPLSLGALIGARYGRRRLGIGIALVLQALVFGAAHANYPGFPAYSRPLELFVPALIWGLIFLRFGLLTTVILHATFDLTLFAIPVFLIDAPGALLQQALIVAAGATPLAIVTWRIARAGGVGELAGRLWNGEWRPSAARPEPAAHAHAPARGNRFAAAFQRALPVLGLAGLAAWVLFAPFHADVPAPRVDRAQAIAAAEQALAARGVTLAPAWRRFAVMRGARDDARQWIQHEFVWREAGPGSYRSLVGNVLAPPVWEVRFATFGGDVVERAEEWRVTVGPGGDVRTVRHVLPEGRPGASLDREAARLRAEAALRARLGVDPAALRAVGAEETRRPARLDWTFTWADPRIRAGKDGEARYVVALAGDEVAAAGRYVFVPEAWVRAERERMNRVEVASMAVGLVLAAAALAALAYGVMSWMRRRYDSRALRVVFVLALVTALAGALNNLPLAAFQLGTTEPVWSQWLTRSLGALATAVLGAMLFALVGGVGAWAARTAPRMPLAGRLPYWMGAVAAALLVLGVQAVLAGLAPRTAPLWPSLPQSQWSTVLGAVLAGFDVAVYAAAAALFVVHIASRLTAGFTRHAWLGVTLIVLLQTAAALAQAAGEYAGALVGGVTGGLTAGAVLWWLIRYDLRMVPSYVAAAAILSSLQRTVQANTPQAWAGFVVQALVTAAMAWLVTRYIARPLNPVAAASSDHDGTVAAPPAS